MYTDSFEKQMTDIKHRCVSEEFLSICGDTKTSYSYFGKNYQVGDIVLLAKILKVVDSVDVATIIGFTDSELEIFKKEFVEVCNYFPGDKVYRRVKEQP